MKRLFLILNFGFLSIWGFGQESQNTSTNYNISNCKDCYNKYFFSTNTGILNTPIGLRIGFLCKTGAYIGARVGEGKVFDIQTNITKKTSLYSITAGLIKPITTQNKLSIYAFMGAGYGQWWEYRWINWTKGGLEIEGGLMISYKRVMLNLGANILMGEKTEANGDATVGIGYRF